MRSPSATLVRLFGALALATPALVGCAAQPVAQAEVPTRTLSTEPASLDLASALPTVGSPDGASPPAGLGWQAVTSTEASADPSLSDILCPAEMALVGGRVCVDRWEASVVELRGGVEHAVSPYHPLGDRSGAFRAVSKPGVVPQGYVSGALAQQACVASGKRLCAADEWELACRGPRRLTFPYGDARRRGACNDDVRTVHPVVQAAREAGLDADQTWREGMNLPEINQLDHSVAPTGDRSECRTEEGVFDMVGNLHEWVDDPDGTFRGGFYMDTTQNGDGCSYQTTAHAFGYHDYSTGFRCCMDPYDVE